MFALIRRDIASKHSVDVIRIARAGVATTYVAFRQLAGEKGDGISSRHVDFDFLVLLHIKQLSHKWHPTISRPARSSTSLVALP